MLFPPADASLSPPAGRDAKCGRGKPRAKPHGGGTTPVPDPTCLRERPALRRTRPRRLRNDRIHKKRLGREGQALVCCKAQTARYCGWPAGANVDNGEKRHICDRCRITGPQRPKRRRNGVKTPLGQSEGKRPGRAGAPIRRRRPEPNHRNDAGSVSVPVLPLGARLPAPTPIRTGAARVPASFSPDR